MSCKPKAKSLRAADGYELMTRFGKSHNPLRLEDGGDMQVPTGPGMDRAGFLARNPNISQAGAGRGMVNPTSVTPQPAAPVAAAPSPAAPSFSPPQDFMDEFMGGGPASTQPAMNPQQMAAQRLQTSRDFDKAKYDMSQAPRTMPGLPSTHSMMSNMPRLRDGGDLHTGFGGDVPGTGRGDKIPARYEPGEFVVSNDMLDAQPGLRQGLRGLRAEVLADKGMTPEMADAKAVSRKGLRADLGWTADTASKYTPPPVNPITGGYVQNEQIPRGSPGLQSGVGVGQTGQQSGSRPPMGQVGEPAAGIQANRAGSVPAGRAGVYSSVREGLKDLGAGLGQQSGVSGKATFLAGRGVRAAAPLVAGAGKLAGAAGVMQNFNDYKINDPDVDSSVSGTWKSLRDGDFAGAGRGLSKGALEAGMDLGSFAANTADYLVPGKAPVSTAYNKMLRNNFGDQLVDNSGSNPAAAPANTASNATNSVAPDYPQANARANQVTLRQGDQGAPGVNPYHGDLTKQINAAPSDLQATGMRANDLYRTKQANGTTMYSAYGDGTGAMGNIVNGDGTKRAKQGNVSIIPFSGGNDGMRAAVAADGGGFSAPEPVMSPLRARLESLGSQPGKLYINQAKILTQLQGQDRQHDAAMASTAVSRKNNAESNASSERNTKANNEVSLRNSRASNMLAMSQAQRDQWNKDRQFGLDRETHNQTLGDKALAGIAKEFTVYTLNKAGEQVADPKASAESLDAVRSILPGITSTDVKTREAAMPDAKALHGIFVNARKQDPVGWEAMKFWKNRRPELSGMPNVEGSSSEELSGFDGPMVMNAENGEVLLKQKDGYKLNLGRLDDRQRKLLNDAQQRGWGK